MSGELIGPRRVWKSVIPKCVDRRDMKKEVTISYIPRESGVPVIEWIGWLRRLRSVVVGRVI